MQEASITITTKLKHEKNSLSYKSCNCLDLRKLSYYQKHTIDIIFLQLQEKRSVQTAKQKKKKKQTPKQTQQKIYYFITWVLWFVFWLLFF